MRWPCVLSHRHCWSSEATPSPLDQRRNEGSFVKGNWLAKLAGGIITKWLFNLSHCSVRSKLVQQLLRVQSLVQR